MTDRLVFHIRRVASRDDGPIMKSFERRKAAYQAFVESPTSDLGDGQADDGVFRKKKI